MATAFVVKLTHKAEHEFSDGRYKILEEGGSDVGALEALEDPAKNCGCLLDRKTKWSDGNETMEMRQC